MQQNGKDESQLTVLKNQTFAVNAHSLVSMTDLHGIITYVNDKFIAVSGYTKAELIGQNHNLLNSNNQAKSYWRAMYQSVSQGKIWHDEIRNKTKHGKHYWVDTTITPNFNSDQQLIGYTAIGTEITYQKEATAQLILAKEQAEADAFNLLKAKEQAESAKFAMNAHSLVSITNKQGFITYVNDKFVNISGYSESELLGKQHSILNSNNQSKGYWKNMYETVSQGKVWRDEVRNRAKNGKYYWVDTTIVPNYNQNNELEGYTSIRTDITAAKKNAALLELAKQQAEIANVTKTDFLANMSHEIRTPMNGVIGMTNLLLNSELNPEQNKLANTVKSSAISLLAIINDILDFSKVESGKMTLELMPFNLGELLEDIGTSMSVQAHHKDLQLICPATPIIQQWVKADPGRIRQVLTNLIGNAIKFTQQGEVSVHVNIIDKTSKQSTFLIEVKDSGIGIEKSKQNKLFDRFSQADTSTTRKYGGTGLGLSICKKLVELMGGEIGINSKVGVGSTFWFTLPLNKTKPQQKIPNYNTEIQDENILIVDDNETNLELMRQLHQIWCIKHHTVNSAESAIKALEQAYESNLPYTIAIVDMQMPNMNGKELGQEIKKRPNLANTKLIMASSQSQLGDASKLKASGFDGYITKPIHQSELFDILLSVSGLKKPSSELITRHSTKEHAQFKAHLLVAEDNATNQLVIEGLLRILGITCDLAANGQEAISALQRGIHYDMIFMDCQMPILDGYAATQKIRSLKKELVNNSIPIIAMTANAMAGDRQKCLDAGMDDYLSKPVNPVKVVSMLRQWLPTLEQNQRKPQTVQAKPDKAQVIFDYDNMATRLMHDRSLICSVAEVFYQDMHEQIAELKLALANNDIAQTTAIMHKMKGAAANIGGVALSTLTLELEMQSKADNINIVKENMGLLEQTFARLKLTMEKTLS